MPAYYENMLVSQSPPLFSHSPPTGFLSEYGPNRFYESPRFCRSAAVLTPPSARRFPPNQQPSLYQTHLQSLTPYKPIPIQKPIRSIIRPIIKPEHDVTSESSEESDDGEKTPKSKKRVVFADEIPGHELEHIKIMSEASTQPPTWSLQFLAHVTQGMISPNPQECWTIDFRQPASDYLEFRRKLETNNVSLENVIIREAESTVVGTVKVKNLSFHKEVFIRSTWDNWKTQIDTYCTFSQIVGGGYIQSIYDTFSFKLILPPKSLEFCVCFKADDKEYWDNNGGVNYKLTNRVSAKNENELVLKLNNINDDRNKNTSMNTKCTSAIDVPKQKWSEYSSPYW